MMHSELHLLESDSHCVNYSGCSSLSTPSNTKYVIYFVDNMFSNKPTRNIWKYKVLMSQAAILYTIRTILGDAHINFYLQILLYI